MSTVGWVAWLAAIGASVGCATPAATPKAEPPAVDPKAPSSSARPVLGPECVGGESWRPGPSKACSSQCNADSFVVSRCVDSKREDVRLQAPCECGPTELGAELAGCRVEQLSLIPLQVIPHGADGASPVDGCKLELTCQAGNLTVACDGEEDGTLTSLCECYLDGATVRLPRSEAWPGEGVQTCHAAAAACLQVTK